MKIIEGGICAAKGFKANGIHCGIRKNKLKKDLALITSDNTASCAAVYTTNKVYGAPITVTRKNIEDGKAKAVICNSGIANTCCTGGIETAERICQSTAEALNINADDIVIASTGVIGQPLDPIPIEKGLNELISGLNENGSTDAAEAIMTTDTVKKEIAIEFMIGDKACRIGGIAKGSGMIHPDMATMLVFITSDVAISPGMLQKALSTDIKSTFNMISIDGDTSTNDMVTVLCNGMADNKEITEDNENFKVFMKALNTLNTYLCRMIAADGEGATKLLECNVSGGKTEKIAKTVAKSVICSSLTKAAMFGADANWGRILCAIGYSGADINVNSIAVSFESSAGRIDVCRNGEGIEFSEEKAKTVLSENEINIIVDLNDGEFVSTAWGCDLTYDYVKINGDYRT
ncbi:MAG: bifunctional glutamate N-acetyltransferase/amino-acid acetyltransferase ArgJ [Clostridia bacterium]|nr:bifunctional glutamate N-acetyltransferase/amino-acid acetyltransferase ArgJ [Clostridia bacterium]